MAKEKDKISADRPVCKRHKQINLPYLRWAAEMERTAKKGMEQTEFKKCGRWLFEDEF